VEIVNLFGWQVLENFWRSVQEDYLQGIEYLRNSDPTDNRILRLSHEAGVDLTPLIHFWGIHPDDRERLRDAMIERDLRPSSAIYDRLVHYATLIPMSNMEFAEHARIVNPKGIREGRSPLYGEGWYYAWTPQYDRTHGEAARAALQKIIEMYFPDGRPHAEGVGE
jgi:hypothetical protein